MQYNHRSGSLELEKLGMDSGGVTTYSPPNTIVLYTEKFYLWKI
jgi:hypothetical protein